MADETATATTNPTDATVDAAAATLLATASTETGTQQQTQTTETQAATATETGTETKTAETKTETATGAPEKYEFTAPEGTSFDSGVLEAFSGAAKTANLSQDAAQKLIETMAPALAARQADQVKAIHEEWTNASKADKEFGGEKLVENLGVARKAYENFATPELRKLLDTTGMGNHPEVIRLMYRIGKAISEDKFVSGSTGTNRAADVTTVLYPTMKKG